MVKAESPDPGFGEIGKLLGEKWAAADEKTKKKVRPAGTVAEAWGREGGGARELRSSRTLTCPRPGSTTTSTTLTRSATTRRWRRACPRSLAAPPRGGHVPAPLRQLALDPSCSFASPSALPHACTPLSYVKK